MAFFGSPDVVENNIQQEEKVTENKDTETNNTNTINNDSQQTEETDVEEQKGNTDSLVVFDPTKAINSDIKNYTIGSGNSVIDLKIDSTQKVLNFSYIPTKVVQFYGLNWASSRTDMVSSKISFDKKIIEVLLGGMGQDQHGDTVFILLEDGSVEYIPVVHMFNHAQDGPISYGPVKGVSGIVRLAEADMGYGVTTLAIKSDGSFYDMWYALKDTGNY